MARDEDIFRKLGRQTPLVKQKALQPLSPKDFTLSRNTINVPVISPDKKRGKNENKHKEPVMFGGESERTPESRREPSRELAFEDEQRSYGDYSGAAKENKVYEIKKTERRPEPAIKSQKTAKREQEPRLDIFSDNAETQRAYEPRPVSRDEAEQNASVIDSAETKENRYSLRHELKFYINYRDYALLRSSLKSLISADPNADSNNSYHVRSLYFDDLYDTALIQKIAGNDSRKKFRIRIYNFRDDNIKFEKKYKVGQYVGKESINLTRDEYDSIIAGDCDFLLERDEGLAKEIYLEIKNSLLRPKVIVDYVREAYVSPFEDCRITFDKDLKAGIMLKDIFDPNAPVMPMYESGIMVLEVKFNKFLPEYIKHVINSINAAERSAISKYVISRMYD